MRPIALEPRDRFALISGGALIATILLLGRGLPLAARWNEREVAKNAFEIRRMRAIEMLAGDREAIRDSLGWYRTMLDSLELRAFGAATPAMAGVALAGTLEHLAAEHQVRASSTVVLADSMFVSPGARVAVRLFAELDSRGLFDLLGAVESSAMGLEVTELTVSQPEPAAGSRQPESLRVEILVSARARPEPSRSRP